MTFEDKSSGTDFALTRLSAFRQQVRYGLGASTPILVMCGQFYGVVERLK